MAAARQARACPGARREAEEEQDTSKDEKQDIQKQLEDAHTVISGCLAKEHLMVLPLKLIC